MPHSPSLRSFVVALGGVFCMSCAGNLPIAVEHPAIPPQVFEKICCWLSDNEQPVMTEINLDAVARNRNQFGYFRAQGDEWVEWNRGGNDGFAKYRFLPDEHGHQMVEFSDNGGGSLTCVTHIGFSILNRTIERDGKPVKIRVLRVESIATIPQPEKQNFPQK